MVGSGIDPCPPLLSPSMRRQRGARLLGPQGLGQPLPHPCPSAIPLQTDMKHSEAEPFIQGRIDGGQVGILAARW